VYFAIIIGVGGNDDVSVGTNGWVAEWDAGFGEVVMPWLCRSRPPS